MIILITVSSGTTSLISLNINIYGYIYLIYNCRLPVLPRGGPLPGSACRGASAQRCQGRTADTGHRTMTWWLSRTNLWTGTRWAIPVAGGRALASGPRQDLAGQPETGQRGQVATNPPQLHRREKKLSAAHSPPPHALLDDPAHQHLAVHVPETRPPSTTPPTNSWLSTCRATPHGPRSSSARGRTGWWGQSLVSVGTCGCLQSLGVEGGGGGKGKGSSPNLFVLKGLGTAGDWALC